MDGWILLNERREGSRERLHWREGGRADRRSGCPSWRDFLIFLFLDLIFSISHFSLSLSLEVKVSTEEEGVEGVVQTATARGQSRAATRPFIQDHAVTQEFNRATTHTLTLARCQTEMSSHALSKPTSQMMCLTLKVKRRVTTNTNHHTSAQTSSTQTHYKL